jgi:polysaccharide export outer membrane protein
MDNGEYGVHELDLRDANILNSPYYYLQQRDIVYVEPNEVQAENTKVGQTTRLWVRGAAITISLGSLLYRVLQ